MEEEEEYSKHLIVRVYLKEQIQPKLRGSKERYFPR